MRAAFRKRLFVEGDDLYCDMIETIANARHCVSLESSALCDDAIGRPLAQALSERAEQGVRVRVLVDALGSLGALSRTMENSLRGAGVRLQRFHRWRCRAPLRYDGRDHRKLLVVDRNVTYLGGFDIDAHNSRRAVGETRRRGTHLRLEGALARQAQTSFDVFWYQRWQQHPPIPIPANDVLISNHNAFARHRLRVFIEHIMAGACRRLWFTAPGLVPDREMQRRLIAVAARGVDVRVLVPGMPSVRPVQWACGAAYAPLLAGGVAVWEYLPRALHARTLLVDDDWAVVGSAGLDTRRARQNYDLSLLSADPALCEELETHFLADLGTSRRARPTRWQGHPQWLRVADEIGWTARRWLSRR